MFNIKKYLLFLIAMAAAALAQAPLPSPSQGGSGGGGGSGCTPSGISGVVQASNGSGACQATSVTDNGTTVVTTEPLQAVGLTSSDTAHSGSVAMKGKTSGTVAWVVADVAGTAIAYILPSTNGASGQFLEDTGSTTCPTLATGAPAVCHATAWTAATITGGTCTNQFVTVISTGGGITCASVGIGVVAGLGAGVGTALAINIGSAGSPVLNGGAGGTPSGLVCTSCTGLPLAGILNAASGQISLATSAIGSGACQTVTPGSVNSVAVTSLTTAAIYGWNPSGSIKAVTGYTPGTSGGLSIVSYVTAGNINWDVCNWTSGSVTPGAVSLNWYVLKL